MASSYKIDFNDGTSNPGNNPITVGRDTRDTSSTDLTIFGRGTFNYGEELNENLLHLLEHFASAEAPRPTATTVEEQRDAVAGIAPGTSNWAIRQPMPGQLWANKTNEHLHVFLQNLNKWDALANSGDVTVNWGTIAHGQTIPRPISATGYQYTDDECAWIVGPSAYGDTVAYLNVAAPARVVAARAGTSASVNSPISAHYMIVGIRDNVNSGTVSGSGGSGNQTLTLSTTPVAVLGQTNVPVVGTLQVSIVDAGGNAVDPANVTFTWYRVTEGGDAACTTVQYDNPTQPAPSQALFEFTATSQYALSCNPSWRVVALHSDGRRGEAIVQMVFNFQAPQNELIVSTNSISYASAQTNELAEATVTATITGGTAPYTVEWSEEAVDGSGALKVSQNPPISPPSSPTGTTLLSDAVYSLQRATAQTVFTRVSITVTDSQGRLARAFTTIRYNFIASGDGSITPEPDPLTMVIDGTLEGVYTIEGSAYIQADAGADSRVFTLEIPVSIQGTSQGTSLSITRLRDTDSVQFNLISPAILPNVTSGLFTFAITASSASAYPGTNSDAWRITFVAQDGRVISRDVITKFNYLTTSRPLTVTVAPVTVVAVAAYEPTPAPTFVTLTAAAVGGAGPYTYLWNVSAISSSAPFKVVGPLDRPTLTLQLRGTTFAYPEFDDVVWPSPTPGTTNHTYVVPVSVTVRDASLPSQQVTANANAGIHFNVNSTDMAVAPLYTHMTTDLTYNSTEPYTMKGRWICNPDFIGSAPIVYETYSRVTLEVIRGSGAYSYTWVEESRAAGSALTPLIVFPDTSAYNKSVSFRASQTNCVLGSRFYEGVWRCDVVDLHTGTTLQHREVVRLDVCQGVSGTIDDTIQRVPYGAGFNCA